jgi:hypothetical protein
MKTVFIAIFLLVANISFSQTDVNKETIKDHIGDSVKYCGKVVTAKLMDRMFNAPAFLNIDGAHPSQVFTVVVWKWDRVNFENKPEKFYLEKNVCIYGKVEKYKEQLQIVVHSQAQIVVQE